MKGSESILAVVVVVALLDGKALLAAPVFEPLGVVAGPDSSTAAAVNADGSVVVGWSGSWFPQYEDQIAWRWTRAGGMQTLQPLPGDVSMYAAGVSGDGSVVVGASGTWGFGRAVRWTSATGTQDLGALPGASAESGTLRCRSESVDSSQG